MSAEQEKISNKVREMKKCFLKRFALALLILVQCVSLVGCGQGSYKDGYEAGLAAAYEAPVAYLTKEAAAALKNVSDDLIEQGYRIKIYDAYRPQTAVDHFKAWAEDLDATEMKPYFYPEVDKSELFDKGYIAAKSGHSRGSTVDLTIVDMLTGREVDMGGGFDYFGELSHPDYTETLTAEQIANRMILREAILDNGFRALPEEWWHFTLENEPYPDTYFDFPVDMPEK